MYFSFFSVYFFFKKCCLLSSKCWTISTMMRRNSVNVDVKIQFSYFFQFATNANICVYSSLKFFFIFVRSHSYQRLELIKAILILLEVLNSSLEMQQNHSLRFRNQLTLPQPKQLNTNLIWEKNKTFNP